MEHGGALMQYDEIQDRLHDAQESRTERSAGGRASPACRDVVGPDHTDRRQPGHSYQDRLPQPQGRRVLQYVVDLPRLQRLHEGERPAQCALHHQPHLRDLRRQPRDVCLLCAEHGLWGQAAGPRRVDHQPRRGGRVHVRSQHLPGQPGGGRLLRADGQGDQPRRARARQRQRKLPTPHGTDTGRSPTSCVRSTRSGAPSIWRPSR